MKGLKLMRFFTTKPALAVAAALALYGCGGGSGGGSPQVTVQSAANPVLVGYSTTVTAAFTAYTSAVRFGSPVRFTVTGPAVVTAAATTKAGGIATAHLSSATPGTFIVSASSGIYTGSTGVSFISQPSIADVFVFADRTIDSLSGIHFVVGYSFPQPFSNVSTAALPALPAGGTPLLETNPAANSSSVTWAYAPGVSVAAASPIMRLRFHNLVNVPNFTIDQQSVDFSDSGGRLIDARGVAKTKYYDSLGKLLFQAP
jgi:hypothetical protein